MLADSMNSTLTLLVEVTHLVDLQHGVVGVSAGVVGAATDGFVTPSNVRSAREFGSTP